MSAKPIPNIKDHVQPKLRFTVGVVGKLLEEHKIDLLKDLVADAQMCLGYEVARKLYVAASRHWDAPPTDEDIDEMEFYEVVETVQAALEEMGKKLAARKRPGG